MRARLGARSGSGGIVARSSRVTSSRADIRRASRFRGNDRRAVSVARRGEARRGLGLSGRVASAPARSQAIERTRRRRPDPASSGDARARERESIPVRGKKDASAALI